MRIASDAGRGGKHRVRSPTMLLREGAVWVTLTSALALPLSYVRNLILGELDATGQVAGTFASLLLLFEIVRTFVLFGGTTAVTHFLAKQPDRERKAGFLLSYSGISIAITAVLVISALLRPEVLDLTSKSPLTEPERAALLCLVPIFLFNQLSSYALAGLMEFRLAAMVAQYQLIAVLAVSASGLFFFPEQIRDRSLAIFSVTIGASNLVGFGVAAWRVYRRVGLRGRRFLPQGFWRFSSQVHLNSICAFAYNSVDQILILSRIGLAGLGGYFLILQISQLIKFVPQRIGQVLLATFSRLSAEEEHDRLRAVYLRLCRLSILLSTALALGMVFLSRTLVGFFGDWLIENHKYLILLAAAMNVGSIGSINSMLVLSKERAGANLINNLVLTTIQLVTMWLLIDDYGVYGVIWGRVAGIVVGQTGLFWILRTQLPEMRLPIPFDFWVSQALVFGSAVVVWDAQWTHPLLALAAAGATGFVYIVAVRLRLSELASLLRR